MRRVTTLCAAAGIAAAALTPAAPAQASYYVIRWENTGICQIWNDELQYKPVEWPSHYRVVSKTVPSFNDAVSIQLQMREKRSCFL